MNTLFLIASIGFLIWEFRNILFWVSLWQLKEYRLDRLSAHLRETAQGRELLFGSVSLVKWLLLFLYLFVIFNEYSVLPYEIFIVFVYLFEILVVGREIFNHQVKRPKITMKTLLIVFLSGFSVGVFFTVPLLQQHLLWLLLLDRVTVLLISFFVFFLSVPTMLYQDYKLDQAIKKRNFFSKLVVIGVTGSYGKSSTKDYIAQILSQSFNVVKTKGTNNTPIGVSQAILRDVKSDTEILVVEMGAYKKGEIAQLCSIAKPHIGVLTAVASQHISLFGSAKKLAEAKYELIDALPRDGLALFNGNNEGSYAAFKKTKKESVLYFANETKGVRIEKKIKEAQILAEKIHVDKTAVTFTVRIAGKELQLTANVLGAHMVENILPGIFLAKRLGMTEREIRQAVSHLTTLPQTMNLKKTDGKYLLDDTFNVNTDGVIAAVGYAQIYEKKRILVMEPMIELGSEAKDEHYRLGQALSKNVDYVFMTKKNFYESLVKGVIDAGGKCLVKVATPLEITEFINNHTGKGDIIIFEGKESGVVLKKLLP